MYVERIRTSKTGIWALMTAPFSLNMQKILREERSHAMSNIKEMMTPHAICGIGCQSRFGLKKDLEDRRKVLGGQNPEM